MPATYLARHRSSRIAFRGNTGEAGETWIEVGGVRRGFSDSEHNWAKDVTVFNFNSNGTSQLCLKQAPISPYRTDVPATQ